MSSHPFSSPSLVKEPTTLSLGRRAAETPERDLSRGMTTWEAPESRKVDARRPDVDRIGGRGRDTSMEHCRCG